MFNSKHYLKAGTFQAWIETDLNERQKTVWFWPFKWYLPPYALVWSGTDVLSEWDKFNSYICRKYPIQYFMRSAIPSYFHGMRYRYRDIKTQVKYLIRNPRKEMRNNVFPAQWHDLTTMVVDFCLEAVIEYVERENALESIDWSENTQRQEIAKQLNECYVYAKTGRKVLLKNIDDAYSNVSFNQDLPYEQKYEEVNKAEVHLKECDTNVCKWVIENRDYLWV